jgi:hypothetical protein
MYHAGVRERSLGARGDGDQTFGMALEDLENDRRQAVYTLLGAAIMSVLCVALIVAAVLSTRACTV